MPKVTLHFNLPEESIDFELCNSAKRMHSVLRDFSLWLRRRYKHTDPDTDQHREEHEEICSAFYECLSCHNVNL